MKIKFILAILFTVNFCLQAEQYTVKQKEITYIQTVRGQSLALKSVGMTTPGHYLPISFIVADGSFVKKGDIVARFDSTDALYEYKSLFFEKKVIEQDLQAELTKIDNNRLAKRDQLDEKRDKLALKRATLKRNLKLPLPDEVLKAEGRLRVASLDHEAAFKDYEKAKERFVKKYISKSEEERKLQALKEKKASLDFAQADLEYQKLPVAKSTLKKIELEIETLELEVDKLKNEVAERETLAVLKKKSAYGKKMVIEREIAMKKGDLEETSVKAPASGYVEHVDSRRKIGPGSRFWRDYRFARIPDLNTISFVSYLPESSRKFYKEGDIAEIYVAGRKGEVIKGRISQIAGVPMDILEKAKQRWGSKTKLSGIKVYRLTVKPDEVYDWMRPGMNADIKLFSGRKFDLPAVPVKYLHMVNGKNYLSVNGVLTEVRGVINQGWFLIEDNKFTARAVEIDGEMPQQKITTGSKSKSSNFRASGEILPLNSRLIVTPEIWEDSKITWLKDEESEVSAGDTLLKLDSVEVDKEIAKQETELLSLTNEVASMQKNLELLNRKNQFDIKKENNLKEIRAIERDVKLQGVDYMGIINAQMSYLKAKISHENALSVLMNLKAKKEGFVSKAEISKAQRDEQRRGLQLELAKISFEEKKKGSKLVERSKANLDFSLQKNKYEDSLKNASYSKAKQENELQRVRLKRARQLLILSDRLKRKKNLIIKSPVNGLLRYEKVYDSGSIQKISLGVAVDTRTRVMSIPNLEVMLVRVPVPERYYRHIKKGMKVKIKISALGDSLYNGTLDSVDYLFEAMTRKDSRVGIYSSQEPLGETVIMANVRIDLQGKQLKPGVIAEVFFPFER